MKILASIIFLFSCYLCTKSLDEKILPFKTSCEKNLTFSLNMESATPLVNKKMIEKILVLNPKEKFSIHYMHTTEYIISCLSRNNSSRNIFVLHANFDWIDRLTTYFEIWYSGNYDINIRTTRINTDYNFNNVYVKSQNQKIVFCLKTNLWNFNNEKNIFL